MVTLSPKEMFLSDDDRVKEYGNITHGITLQTAVALAITQFSLSGPTTEEMAGARKFIQMMLNIGEREEKKDQPVYKSIASFLPPKTHQPPKP